MLLQPETVQEQVIPRQPETAQTQEMLPRPEAVQIQEMLPQPEAVQTQAILLQPAVQVLVPPLVTEKSSTVMRRVRCFPLRK